MINMFSKLFLAALMFFAGSFNASEATSKKRVRPPLKRAYGMHDKHLVPVYLSRSEPLTLSEKKTVASVYKVLPPLYKVEAIENYLGKGKKLTAKNVVRMAQALDPSIKDEMALVKTKEQELQWLSICMLVSEHLDEIYERSGKAPSSHIQKFIDGTKVVADKHLEKLVAAVENKELSNIRSAPQKPLVRKPSISTASDASSVSADWLE